MDISALEITELNELSLIQLSINTLIGFTQAQAGSE